ncbi:hypothetical protein [Ralstonia solanacearum]|uniref:hypothetical protein n=1 Tax=Ralstonia solanacearum TaxID=305 RepID=UPI0018D16E55|nr:hypothetical protein [Ralstonia solanacearum]
MKIATPNKLGAWFARNDIWLQTLIASLVITFVPTLVTTFAPELQLPNWAVVLCLVIGCLGAIIAGMRALATDTLSAQLFCFSAASVGWTFAIFQIVALLKH